MTWTYDRYGKITSATRIYDPQNDPLGITTNCPVNASTNRLTGYLTYDAAGNLTSRGTCDAENRLTSTTGLNYLYGGHSRRLRKLENGKKTYFVYSVTGRMLVEDNWTDAKTKNQIYSNGQLLATHDQADYVQRDGASRLDPAALADDSAALWVSPSPDDLRRGPAVRHR